MTHGKAEKECVRGLLAIVLIWEQTRSAIKFMALFKYLPPDRVDVVESLRIRFTPANEFNDPFECLSDARLIEHAGWQKRVEDRCVTEMLREGPSPGIDPALWTESELRQIHRERYALRLPMLKQLASVTLCAARAPLRILCLSQVAPDAPDAFLLWGHYTCGHSGLVIELDAESAWVKSHKESPGSPKACGPVDYANDRPSWLIDAYGNAEPRPEFIFTKSTHWRYEQEYRLVRVVAAPTATGSVDVLVPFPPDSLRSVTLGVNASRLLKQKVTRACKRRELQHVQIKQAQIHPDQYALTVTEYKEAEEQLLRSTCQNIK